MKLSLKRKKKDDVAADVEAVEEKSAPVAVKPVGGGAQEWLLLHAEKLVCAGVAVLLGLMVYSAWGKLVPNKQHTPEILKEKVSAVNRSVEQSQFPLAKYPVPAFAEDARRGQASVPHAGYSFKSVAGDDIGDLGGKRADPQLYPPIDLEAKAGVGVFFVKQKDPGLQGLQLPVVAKNNKPLPSGIDRGVVPPAGALREGRRWVVVNALVPITKQMQEFDRCFKGASEYDEQRDAGPAYIMARIQRLEIQPGTPADKLDWSEAKEWGRSGWTKVATADAAAKRAGFATWYRLKQDEQVIWAATADEVVDEQYLAASLCETLGPLGKSWKTWATHSRIPFSTGTPQVDKTPQRLPRTQLPPKSPRNDNEDKPPIEKENPFGTVVEPDAEQPQPDEPAEPEKVEEKPKPKPVLNKLVRVFDFSVEPGRSYRYRVELAIANPNYGVAARLLVEPESGGVDYRYSGWSEPSETVRVPDDAQVLAASVLPPTEEIREPRVDIIANLLDIAAGMAPAVRLQLRRGEVVGGKATGLEVDSEQNMLAEHVGLQVMTDVTVLDFGGSGTLAPGIEAPTKMLVLDGSGNLTVKNSANDAAGIAEFDALEGAQAPAQDLGPKPATGGPKKPDDKDAGDVGKLLGS